jgi:hypothetical protein
MMSRLLVFLGIILMLVGASGAFGSSREDTTVASETGSTRVHNMGLIARQQCDVTCYAMLAIVGAAFFGSGFIAVGVQVGVQDSTDRLDELVDLAKEERDERHAAARRNTTQTRAEPARPNVARLRADAVPPPPPLR